MARWYPSAYGNTLHGTVRWHRLREAARGSISGRARFKPKCDDGLGSNAMHAESLQKECVHAFGGPKVERRSSGSTRYRSNRISGSPNRAACHARHFSSMRYAPASGKVRLSTRSTRSIALFICANHGWDVAREVRPAADSRTLGSCARRSSVNDERDGPGHRSDSAHAGYHPRAAI